MKSVPFPWRILSAVTALALASLACGAVTGAPEPVAPQPTVPLIPTDAPPVAAPPTEMSSTEAPPVDLNVEGVYSIGGYNADDGSSYAGSLSIQVNNLTPQVTDVVYDLAWDTGGMSYGTGILIKDVLAASFGGSSCGAVFYTADAGMNLTGIWVTLQPKELGTENAAPYSVPSSFAGGYSVQGTNSNGSGYSGSLNIIQQGQVWQLAWEIGSDAFDGIGISSGNVLAAAYGGAGCGVALYAIQPNGDLDGIWGVWGNDYLGTEYATR